MRPAFYPADLSGRRVNPGGRLGLVVAGTNPTRKASGTFQDGGALNQKAIVRVRDVVASPANDLTATRRPRPTHIDPMPALHDQLGHLTCSEHYGAAGVILNGFSGRRISDKPGNSLGEEHLHSPRSSLRLLGLPTTSVHSITPRRD